MALVAATRLGPYEIVAPLGAGGMGEVYRARDTRLGREVAIKVLPSTLSQDADRLRRFEQEARAAGALNHPNILSLYDLGTHDGSPYLVCELLEGETLRRRLESGAPPARKAIEYGLQVARGMAAAHDKGIVHRDLKPENLFLTKDGQVKILDFGLAKLTRPEGMPLDSAAPTLPSETDAGVVMGTAGYMSPEQVRGQPADHRSDIFTFGSILYEMLSGKRAFRRDSAAETMTAILREEPPDLAESNRSLPPGLERIVRHCLEKRPEERFQSARDLAFDLEELSGLSSATAPRPMPARGRAWLRPRLLAGSVAVVVLLALAWALGRWSGLQTGKGQGMQAQPSYKRLTFRRGVVRGARFAPDGHTILYAASWEGKPLELFTTRAESPESRALDLGASQLAAVSPSAEMALLLRPESRGIFPPSGTLATMPLSGGAPREILEDVRCADYAPDGRTLAVIHDVSNVSRLEFPIGKVLYEANWLAHCRVSPQGGQVAFLEHLLGGDEGSVNVVDLAGKKTTLSSDWVTVQGLAWSPDGHEVWFTGARSGVSRGLYAVTLEGKERLLARVTGTLTLKDVFRDGRVLLAHDDLSTKVFVRIQNEARERDLSWLDWSTPEAISSDGKVLLFVESGEGGGNTYAVYLRKTDGSPAVRIGEGSAFDLSADGKWVIAGPLRTPRQLVLLPTGPGEVRPLTNDAIHHWAGGFLPDGKGFGFIGNEPGRPPRAYVQRIGSPTPRAVTPEGVLPQAISPDGKLLAVLDRDGKLLLYPVEGGEPRAVPGFSPLLRAGPPWIRGWSNDGRSLYVRRSHLPARVYRFDLATGREALWLELMPADTAGLVYIGAIVPTPDGNSYAYSANYTLSQLFLVEGIK